MRSPLSLLSVLLLVCGLLAAGCSGDASPGKEGGGDTKASSRGGSGGGPPSRRGGGRPGDRGGEPQAAAVPVEVSTVERTGISATWETHGTLEAEKEVDLVARATGPIVRLEAEAGDSVREGQLLARLDQAERKAQLQIARVALDEAESAWKRTNQLAEASLVSPDEVDRVRADLEAARAQLEAQQIALDFTEIRAPFTGLVVRRYVKFAEHVQSGSPLFRLSDFDPLWVRIQVPERELPRLEVDQPAGVRVEAWPDSTFAARVLRISPVVDAGSGTVEVTLEVDAEGRLRPGMFGRVDLELESRPDALVIPKDALALDGLGDAVYVVVGDAAERREIRVGAREGNRLEVLSGLEAGESIVVVGQDGLADGTPVRVMDGAGGAGRPEGDS